MEPPTAATLTPKAYRTGGGGGLPIGALERATPRTISKAERRGKRTRIETQALRKAGIIKVVPTVMRLDGLRVVVYPNDHRPAHVHVMGRGHEAVFNLNCPARPVELRENFGFPSRELSKTLDILTGHLEDLCQTWERIHGIA